MPKNSLGLPDHVVQLLAAADARNGLPAGTMFSVMTQESGGQGGFLDAPDTPHYPSGVAPNGTHSTAFGPFGITESTAKAPGFGVAPLKDKSLEEQIRFASDYLGGRVKAAGGDLKAGLAGYGEGVQYANQVASRIGAAPGTAPVVAAAPAAPAQTPVVVAQADTGAPAPVVIRGPITPAPADPSKDPWYQFLQANEKARITPAGLSYGVATPAAPVKQQPVVPLGPLDYQELLASNVNTRANFGPFQGLAHLGRRAS